MRLGTLRAAGPLALLALLAACSGGEPEDMDALAGHKQALEATDPKRIGTVAPGSAQEKAAIERFRDLFSDFSPEPVRRKVRAAYSADVWFNDTLKTVRGADALESYLVSSAGSVESCTFEHADLSSHDGEYYFRWRMHIRFKRFQKGKVNNSIGMSHVRFDRDGKVVYQQDYWDSAAGLFEQVPVLGGVIRAIKRRL